MHDEHKKRREGESKYVAIHLLCTANSRKMLKISLVESFYQRNQFHFRDDDRNHPTANVDDHHSKQHTHTEREKKLIVFIVSSNLLMSKIGASKENQIKKVPFSLFKCMWLYRWGSRVCAQFFFWLCRSSNKRFSESAWLSLTGATVISIHNFSPFAIVRAFITILFSSFVICRHV